MKISSIINLTVLLPTFIVLGLVGVLSGLNYLSTKDYMLILSIGLGILAAIINLTIKRQNSQIIIISIIIFVFTLVNELTQTNFFYSYWADGRGKYSLIFIIWFTCCSLASIFFIVSSFRQLFYLNKKS